VNICEYMTKAGAEAELVDRERTSVRLPEDLLNEFRHLAIDKKSTVTDLLIEAMKMYLKANRK
jgi:metal-responsive CopG/Arc/MetJ family transcriptional regulator